MSIGTRTAEGSFPQSKNSNENDHWYSHENARHALSPLLRLRRSADAPWGLSRRPMVRGSRPCRANWNREAMSELFEIEVTSSATLSVCRKYRYEIWRRWRGGDGTAVFIGLNPSTADATQDDPTIRRCVGFARQWGFDWLFMGNLYAYRSTDPKPLRD